MELPLSWAQSSPAVLGWICDPLPALPLPLQSREGANRAAAAVLVPAVSSTQALWVWRGMGRTPPS